MLQTTTKAEGALFNFKPKSENDNDQPVNVPLMTGQIKDGNGLDLQVGAFHKVSGETGTEYLSLSIGFLGDKEHKKPIWYGKLFKRQEEGKQPSYFGFVDLTPYVFDSKLKKHVPMKGHERVKREDGTYEDGPQLRLKGKRAVSNDGKTRYVKLSMFPANTVKEEDDQESELSF